MTDINEPWLQMHQRIKLRILNGRYSYRYTSNTRKKLSGSSGLKWNFVVTNGNESKKKKKIKKTFQNSGEYF